MPTLRHATIDDATLIGEHRHAMFIANEFATEEQLAAMDANFLPWVHERLADGRYVGLLLEEDGKVMASGGIFFMDFPPHYLHTEPGRPYLLNFYTAEEARGKGYAKRILQASIDLCRERGYKVITLHASPFGKPIYEKANFAQTNEMMLKL
ncbi:N-acetyltransferase family protein [Terriglobus sp. RCC_193]|uniref:GNAT family N-acetyltransferase n=1 Tax=Terriglobus sp. RCC_193 TaxID=3239218 RepID=UPI003526156E